MSSHRDDFDEFELFIKSTLNSTGHKFPNSKRKIIHDEPNIDNLPKNDDTPLLNNLHEIKHDDNSSTNTHSSSTSSRENYSTFLNNSNIISSSLLENLAPPSTIQNTGSPKNNAFYTAVSRLNNRKRTRLIGGLPASDSSNSGDTSDDLAGVIVVDDSGNLSDSDSDDVMFVGSNLPSRGMADSGRSVGSVPVDRFVNENYPQWDNPQDDTVVGPASVKTPVNNRNNFFVKDRKIIQMDGKDDDCVALTPTETQECLWRETFMEKLEYFLRCPICFRSLHKIGQGDAERTPESLKDASRIMYSTKCGHLFCSKCIEYIRKKRLCPICRKPVKDKTCYHPLYP